MPAKPAHTLSPFLVALALVASCTSEPAPSLAVHARRPEEPAPAAPEDRGEVRYHINRGATLRRIANLYKLDYSEIYALNPRLSREEELGANTEVVVYRRGSETSESVGLPHDGRLVGGMPMLEGPGRRLTNERWKMWGTRSTVLTLDRVLRLWAERYPNAPEVLVGNLSAREGGPLVPHKTHQSGRDADLSYVARWDGRSEVNWQHMTAENLDADLTWKLLRLLDAEAEVEVFYADRSIQRALLTYAKNKRLMSNAELQRFLEVAPGATRAGALVRHVPGHRDHFHVRFRCPTGERRCRS